MNQKHINDCVVMPNIKFWIDWISANIATLNTRGYVLAMGSHIKDIISSKDARVFEIDPNLISMITNTNNKVNYRHSPFREIFLDISFEIYKGVYLKGLIISDQIYKDSTLLRDSDGSKKEVVPKQERLVIYYLAFDSNDGGEFRGTIYIPEGDSLERREYESKRDEEIGVSISKNVGRVVVNSLDLINYNCSDIEKIEITYTKEHNEKRERRGKTPKPNRVIIRPTKQFREIVEDFNSGFRQKYSHKFMVRGHYRKYISLRYRNLKGKVKWIYPYWKGQGIKIRRDYSIKNKEANS